MWYVCVCIALCCTVLCIQIPDINSHALLRYAVKLLYDEASLGEMDSHTELAEALGEFDSDCFIAPQTEGGWEEAVLTQVPRLFSIARDQENVSTTCVPGTVCMAACKRRIRNPIYIVAACALDS